MIIEYVTLLAYMIVLLVLGTIFARYNKNLSDFVRGGAKGTWWLVGTSIFIAGVSAFTFTGNASAAFEAGPSLLIIYIANVVGFAAGALFLGPWLRQTRAHTTADISRARFGTPVEQLSAWIGVFLGPVNSAIQLYALAVFASTTLDLPLLPVLVTIGIVVTFYSTTGGKWAVMATDFVQSAVMMSVTFLIFFLSLKAVGGISGFIEHFNDPIIHKSFQFFKEPGAFPGDRFTLKWALITFFMQLSSQISLTAAGRYISAKDGKEASRASWLGVALASIGSLIWFVPPMVARFLYEKELMASGLENPTEGSYAFIAVKLLPNGMVGMLIAAMFAATMSSMDSGLNNQVGILVRNIIPRLRGALGFKEGLKPNTEIRICHIATLFLGAVIISYAVLFSLQQEIALFDAYLIIGSVIGIPMGFPKLMGLWVKGLPKWSYFPILGGCLIPSIWSFLDDAIYGNAWTMQDRTMWILIFGFSATIVCWLLRKYTPERSRRDVEQFFETMHKPVDYDREIGASPIDFEQYFIIAKAMLVVGSLVLLITLIPNTNFHRLCIIAVSGFILSIGILLYFQGKRVRKAYFKRYDELGEQGEVYVENELAEESLSK